MSTLPIMERTSDMAQLAPKDLNGPALAWAMYQAVRHTSPELLGDLLDVDTLITKLGKQLPTRAASDWLLQDLVLTEKISVIAYGGVWRATNGTGVTEEAYSFLGRDAYTNADGSFSLSPRPGWGDEEGPAPSVAIMRCYVAMHSGQSVYVPEELCS